MPRDLYEVLGVPSDTAARRLIALLCLPRVDADGEVTDDAA